MKLHFSLMSVLTLSLGVSITYGPLANAAEDEETLIELESYIVGDKEQPAVSYFVPWQGTSTPDNLHWNIEDKNDKTLDLVDRDVMLRSIDIYDQLNLEGAQTTISE